MKFLKIKFHMNIIYMTKSILPRFFFSHYIDLSKIVKNVDVERWLFKLIKKRRIENDMYTNKLTEKLLKYKQK